MGGDTPRRWALGGGLRSWLRFFVRRAQHLRALVRGVIAGFRILGGGRSLRRSTRDEPASLRLTFLPESSARTPRPSAAPPATGDPRAMRGGRRGGLWSEWAGTLLSRIPEMNQECPR